MMCGHLPLHRIYVQHSVCEFLEFKFFNITIQFKHVQKQTEITKLQRKF